MAQAVEEHMSKSTSVGKSQQTADAQPRAIIHKQILTAAEENPHMSIQELADEVTGARVELIERVLDDYGDPADDVTDSKPMGSSSTTPSEPTEPTESQPTEPSESKPDEPMESQSIESTVPDSADREDTDPATEAESNAENTAEMPPVSTLSTNDGIEKPNTPRERNTESPSSLDLTDKQRTVLREVYDNPELTQGEIAEGLGVCRSTVCHRVKDIPDFEWQYRQEFVEQLVESGDLSFDKKAPEQDRKHEDGLDVRIDELSEQVARLEDRITPRSPSTLGDDPQLAHKIFHACVSSDRVTEEEELQLVKMMLDS